MICEAPALHGGLGLSQRVELSLAGFLLQDLWKILARRREIRSGVKKGQHWMAPQTTAGLQSIALTIATMCLSKTGTWNPWNKKAQCLSEIHIERHFGRIRSMSQSGDVTIRSYWAYAAAQARKQLFNMKKHSKEIPATDDIPALSAAELLANFYYFIVPYCIHLYPISV